MKPNFLKDKTSIMVLEKEEKKQVQSHQKVENKPVLQPQKLQEKAASEEVKPKVNLFSAKTFEDVKEKSEKMNFLSNKFTKIEQEQVAQEKQVSIEEEHIEEDEFVSFSPKPKQKKKEWKFRLKMITAVYCVVIALMAGWVTTNIVRIANINTAITQSQGEVSANLAKYISEIQKLDDLKENPDNNSSLIPIDEIITVTPLPAEDVTEFEKESNWFDNMINWFGNLFGG